METPTKHGRSYVAWISLGVVLVLYGTLAFALLLVVFCAEENWRGAQAWEKTKTDLAAQGESLDPTQFIPAPISDAENFGALPFFEEVPDTTYDSAKPYKQLAIKVTLKPLIAYLPISKEEGAKPDYLPYIGNWQKGETPDPVGIRKQLEALYLHRNPDAKIPANATAVDIFTLICPVLGELRAANATHPACRFSVDYANPQPWEINLGPITYFISLAQVLAYEEHLALISHQPQLALDDVQVALKINAGLRREPMLVSGLIGAGVLAINFQTVNQGLAEHAWDDQQLATLDEALDKMDYLEQSQFSLRSETTFFVRSVDYFSTHRSLWAKIILTEDKFVGNEDSWKDFTLPWCYALIPTGWYDLYKADGVRMLLGGVDWVDPVSRRVFPEKEKGVKLPPEWLTYITGSNGVAPVLNCVKKYAYLQTQIDEARIACRLERFRLAHGCYPAMLDELVPTYGATLPRDIMSGESYHYSLNTDGSYLLYSIGWNQKDDKGDASDRFNSDSPDWIWANHPKSR